MGNVKGMNDLDIRGWRLKWNLDMHVYVYTNT